MGKERALGRGRGLGSFLNEAGYRLAWLRTLAQPISRALQVKGEIIALLQRVIGAQFLDAFAVPRAATISHDNAKNRLVLRANALHPNFYCHKPVSLIVRGWETASSARAAAALFEKEGRA